MQEFYLKRRASDETVSPECVYRAYPQVGVFRSEEDFLKYLGGSYHKEYGPSIYLGIKDENGNFSASPVVVHSKGHLMNMNYEISGDDNNVVKAQDMTKGQMGYIVLPSSGDNTTQHLVWMAANRVLYSLTDPRVCWPADICSVSVRLLRPGETVTIRGK